MVVFVRKELWQCVDDEEDDEDEEEVNGGGKWGSVKGWHGAPV